MRGQHLALSNSDSNSDKTSTSTVAIEYQQNWLTASGQKLFNSSVSQYLCNLDEINGDVQSQSFTEEESNNSTIHHPLVPSTEVNNEKVQHLYNFLEYLADARQNIEYRQRSTRIWKNKYDDYCVGLNQVDDENIVFCGRETNDNNNEKKSIDFKDEEGLRQSHLIITDDTIDLTSLPSEPIASFNQFSKSAHHQRKMKSNVDLFHLQNIQFDEQTNRIYYGPQSNVNLVHAKGRLSLYYPENSPEYLTATHIGLFLTTLLERLSNFFDNDILTNLHLTGLITSLCHFPHRLLLQLFFDETLSRDRDVPCLLHMLQKIGLAAQGFCDRIYDFENLFRAAKSSLQSMPIGGMNCKLLTEDYQQRTKTLMVTSNHQQETTESMYFLLFSINYLFL